MSVSKGLPEVPRINKTNNFYEAIALTPHPTEHDQYLVDIKGDWCIGIVPQGGYLMSIIAHATSTFFQTHHTHLNQPDMITSNFEFLGRSIVGPAEVHIKVLKTGRQFSVARVQLHQSTSPSSPPHLAIEALISQGNLTKEAQNGLLTLPTRPVLREELPARQSCITTPDPLESRRPALHKLEAYLPPDVQAHDVQPSLGPSVRCAWVRWSQSTAAGHGRGFDVTALGFLADTFRPLPEQYGLVGNWYPTLNARVEVKKPAPEGGWDWLFMRVEMRVVRHGRFDYEVLILDGEGELVAVSNHTGLIVGAERNSKVKGAKI